MSESVPDPTPASSAPPSAAPPSSSERPSSERLSSSPPSSGRLSSAAPSSGSSPSSPGGVARLGADWIAVIVAGVLVVLAGLGLLPAIPFLIK